MGRGRTILRTENAFTVTRFIGVFFLTIGVLLPGIAVSQVQKTTPRDTQSEAGADDARRWIAEGQRLYKAGLYVEAIHSFEKAYEHDADDNILFRIAITYQQLRDWDRCAGYMGRFLDTAQPGPKRDRARNTKEICDQQRQTGQTLTVDSVPPGASVYLGNRKKPQMQGQTPFTMTISPGVQRVWVELTGYRPEIRDIQIQRDQPFNLNVVMRPDTREGWLFVDSPIRDAEVYVDGQPLRLTPFDSPVQLLSGTHQVIVRRSGYTGFKQRVDIEPYLMTRLDAPLEPLENRSTWRSSLGWALELGGALAIGGGVTAMHFADKEYNDTQRFEDLSDLETMGYAAGTVLLTTGTALIIWDLFVDDIPRSHRNPEYGRDVMTPDPVPEGYRTRTPIDPKPADNAEMKRSEDGGKTP